MLFARSIDVQKGKKVLVWTVFTNFKKRYEVCDLHAAREYHKDAIPVCDAFIERMSGGRECVNSTERSKRNHPEQKEALLYCRYNCLVWSVEHSSTWSSLKWHRYRRCTSSKHKPWQLLCFAQLSYLGWRHYLEGPPSEFS